MAQSTGGYIGFLFNSVAGLIVSVIMLRSNIFSKVTAYIGILGNALLLLPGPPSEFVPADWYISLVVIYGIGGILLVIWYVLTARKLYYLGRHKS